MVAGIMMSGCHQQPLGKQVEMYGQWACAYQLRDDGTKNFDSPYNLLEFEYSDGFILNADGSGKVVWYEKENGDFAWEKTGSKLVFQVMRTENNSENFEFKISDLTAKSMLLESPGGKQYVMEKK